MSVFLLCVSAGTLSADEPARQKTPTIPFECRWTDAPITITGTGTDPAWKNAQLIDHFYLPWLGEQARAAKTKTRAKLLWDREYLYFFADMEDHDLYATIKEHNGQLWNNDVFELFFQPAGDKPGYYEFQVNAAGAVLDCFFPRRNAGGFERFKNQTTFHVDAKVHLRGTLNDWTDKDDGWSVEGKIPWTDFLKTGGRPERGEKWQFALCRYDYSVDFDGPETSTCAPLTKPSFHQFEDYGTLTFIGPEGSAPKDKAGNGRLEKRLPLTTSRVIGSPEPPPPYRTQRVYPDMKIAWPLITAAIPNSDQLLVITLDRGTEIATIYRMKDDPKVRSWDLWLDTKDTVVQIEFHPQWAKNGYVYLGGNGPQTAAGNEKKTRVFRYTMETKPPYNIVPDSKKLIIEVLSNGHNGGAPVFGPDGMLYITTGDGTSDSDTNVVGQNMASLLSKVLRIDVDHPDPGKAYSIPKDNPFVNMKGARPEIWSLGYRNPWRMCLDKKTGQLWLGQNGQDLWEQAYVVKKGDNAGWSVTEGSYPFYLKRKQAPVPIVKPTVEHPHSEARSLTGGLVYYGKKYPDLVGHYIYGDYSTGKIWAVKHDGEKVIAHREIADTRLSITGFGTDTSGEILIASFQRELGGLYTLVPTPRDWKPAVFPRKLSESGLFESVKGHVMKPALIPYSVNAVLWSDGASKQRWLALPGDKRIEYRNRRAFEFPDETVIVKSFSLEMEEGNPQSKRWIETRFLTKQDNEWYGYSYSWNDAQTEGELVEAKGADREFAIKTAAGAKKLNWRYPSRAECMVCHCQTVNFVLGFNVLQMNHEHMYPPVDGVPGEGVRENQLAVFERLGLFKVDWASAAREQLRKGLESIATKEEVAKLTATKGQREPVESSLLPSGPDKLKKLVDPYDKKQDLTARVRSYLHSNCAQCHVMSGGGNAQMELEFTNSLEEMKIINVKPVHDTFGLEDARLVAPGHPERSVLLHRISHRGKGHMPPLATRVVDEGMVETIREWILQLPTGSGSRR
jgi:uncharacterized repeat protein (TIGR03806 family)